MRISGGLRHISELRDPAPSAPVEIIPPPVSFELQPSTDEAKLNKTEKAWLEVLRRRGCEQIGVQSITLKLGDDCRYTPDFWTLESGRFVFHEVKGFQREDSLVKMKTAARSFRWANFVKVERIKGEWIETKIKP